MWLNSREQVDEQDFFWRDFYDLGAINTMTVWSKLVNMSTWLTFLKQRKLVRYPSQSHSMRKSSKLPNNVLWNSRAKGVYHLFKWTSEDIINNSSYSNVHHLHQYHPMQWNNTPMMSQLHYPKLQSIWVLHRNPRCFSNPIVGSCCMQQFTGFQSMYNISEEVLYAVLQQHRQIKSLFVKAMIWDL